jgi:hypothetical protein
MVSSRKSTRRFRFSPPGNVIRLNCHLALFVWDVVIGDIVFFTAEGVVPFDGIFLSSYGVTCAKQYEETSPGTMEYLISMLPVFDTGDEQVDCFMHSGEKVLQGLDATSSRSKRMFT